MEGSRSSPYDIPEMLNWTETRPVQLGDLLLLWEIIFFINL